MPYGEVKLVPGLNVERTPTLLEAGYSATQLIRFRDGLAQKFGGWSAYYASAVTGVPRELHAWKDLNGNLWLGIGTTTRLLVINAGTLTDITPQTLTTNPAPNLSTINTSQQVVVVDPNIGTATLTTGPAITQGIDAVRFNVPLNIATSTTGVGAGLVVCGFYQSNVNSNLTSGRQFAINAAATAVLTVNNQGVAPVFGTVSGSNFVGVFLKNGFLSPGQQATFNVSTSGNNVTISGNYLVPATPTVISLQMATLFGTAPDFFITTNTLANANGTFAMNSGNAQYVYYLATGYNSNEQTGTKIAQSDWTLDHWGQLLLACAKDGPVYQWSPGASFSASPVGGAPAVSRGMFVSQSQQVLICFATSGAPGTNQTLGNPGSGASTINGNLGINQDLLTVAWSTVGDYTTFTPLATNQAGSFRIPSGAEIRGGMAVANQNLIWTDIDCWAMNYIGPPDVYSFNKLGSGVGLISLHAAQQFRGAVYWMGPANFYVLDGQGARVLPCPVWDAVFQNLSATQTAKIRAMPNTPFNEIGWLYPSTNASENDSYVKYNVIESAWDYGTLARSAWMDQSVLGTPIAADSSGNIWQHETGFDAGNATTAMLPSFTTGYFYIAEGEDYAYVDQVIPDMKWGYFGGTNTSVLSLTFNVVNFLGDPATTYGPFTMNATTEYISTRFRGRQMSVTLSGADTGSFWRLGKIRYRWTADGRR